jgi:MFS family permease
MGLTQGLLATLVADTAPAELRGTAYGMFNLLTGLALLAASVIAGALWDAIGPKGTFFAGAAFSALAVAGLLTVRRPATGVPHDRVIRFEVDSHRTLGFSQRQRVGSRPGRFCGERLFAASRSGPQWVGVATPQA